MLMYNFAYRPSFFIRDFLCFYRNVRKKHSGVLKAGSVCVEGALEEEEGIERERCLGDALCDRGARAPL